MEFGLYCCQISIGDEDMAQSFYDISTKVVNYVADPTKSFCDFVKKVGRMGKGI